MEITIKETEFGRIFPETITDAIDEDAWEIVPLVRDVDYGIRPYWEIIYFIRDFFAL